MSSSRPEQTVPGFIRFALELLRRELPQAYYQMCNSLAGRSAVVRVEGEELGIAGRPFELAFVALPRRPDITVETDCRTILRVIDAELTLEEAVRSGDLFVVGDRASLPRFHEALLTFVRGAVRSPGFPHLLEEFRWFAESRRGG